MTALTDRKTVNIRDTTYDDLTQIGKKGETYDDIIIRLIKYYKKGSKWPLGNVK